MRPEVISDSKNSEILELLHIGSFEKVIELINQSGNQKKSFFGLFKKEDQNLSFSLKILESCLNEKLIPSEYGKVQKLSFTDDFLPELNELSRILLTLEDYQKAPEKEKLIAVTLAHVIHDGVNNISKNSNDYPNNSISAKVWMDGAGLRSQADELVEYFSRKNNEQRTLEALFLRAKLTNAIMNHYPNIVGPDMIAIANQYEKMGANDEAKQFYDPVVADFTPLVQDAQASINDPEIGASAEDVPITQSLIDALEGLKRIGHPIDEKVLENAHEIMKKLTDS